MAFAIILAPCLRPPDAAAQGRGLFITLGAGGGFGIGLWAGLTAFDDAIHADRKVWTTAVAGAGAGAATGYLLYRATHRADASAPDPSAARRTNGPATPLSLAAMEALARTVRFTSPPVPR